MKYLNLIINVLFFFSLNAQSLIPDECYAEKHFLIVSSTTDYKTALVIATQSSKALQLPLQLRGLKPKTNGKKGLTLPKDSCILYMGGLYSDGDEQDCYFARGRFDEGDYVSIEYSDAYESFAKGYFIVVLGNSYGKNETLKASLKKAKLKYKDAYIKRTKVYMCCMH
jgi:hypothetical protein